MPLPKITTKDKLNTAYSLIQELIDQLVEFGADETSAYYQEMFDKMRKEKEYGV